MKLLIIAALAVAFMACFATAQPASDRPQPAERPATDLDTDNYAFITMETNRGDIVILLDRKHAPITVENFLKYVKDGHYDGTVFHRIIPTFMIQGGGFDETYTQKPTGQPIKNEWTNGLKNIRGSLSMARLGNQPDSATTQFFINVVDNAVLDMNRDGAAYAVFGTVIEGMDAVDAIRNTPTAMGNLNGRPAQDVPTQPQVIRTASVIEHSDLSDSALAEAAKWQATVKRWVEQRDIERKQQEQAKERELDEAKAFVKQQGGDPDKMVTTDTGLMIIDEVVGSGEQPASTNATVSVHYTGWLTNGTKFDSSRDRGQPASFPLNRVIPGWTQGVSGMKVGGKRWLIIPSDLGYGDRGSPPVIPGGAMLIFEVELLSTRGG